MMEMIERASGKEEKREADKLARRVRKNTSFYIYIYRC